MPPFRPTRSAAPLRRSSLGALALACLAASAAAQDDRCHVRLTPYAWATDVRVDTRLDGRGVVDETIPVEDLLEDLETTFQGRIEVQKGALGLLADVFHVSMADDARGLALPQGAGTADVGWTLDMTIADVAVTWDPGGDRIGLSFLCGARILDQRARVDASFATSSGTSEQDYAADSTLVDALVGVRYRRELTSRLSFQGQLDASSGGTDFTWSAFPSLAWSFGDGRTALVAGYRHMTFDFEEEGGLDTELGLSGPLIGLCISL